MQLTPKQKSQARIFFENRILKADNQAFEDLFTEIMRYKESDFRSIKPWGNIGDRKNDGYIPSRGIFYQVYAPENIENSYPKLIKKIKDDASGLIEQWSDIKEFYFVLNDKYKGVNADSEQLLTQIKEDNGLDESKFITASDLENILFSLSDDQIIKITGVSFIDNPILTPAILQNSYLKKFSTISLLTIDTPKPIDEIFINLAIIKEKKEEINKDKTINREALLSSYEEIHKPKEPIAIKELINTSKKSLIYGKAGIGKTMLCKYISYKWAKKELYQEFEYVIYISLREWKTKGLKGAIKDNYYSQDEEKITLDIKDNNTQMFFLFDGYDELDGDKKKILRDEIEHYGLTHYIITTRPYGYQKSDFRVDEYFETIGFTDEDVAKYIDVFFKENKDKAKSLKAYLKTNISIKHIGYIPLMLEMICSQWEQKEFNESLTMTELYTKSIENIFFEYTEKNGTAYIQDKEEEIFNYLGKIAFEGLKQQTIVLDKKIIKEKRSFFSDYVLKAGFLNDGKAEKSNPLLNSYQFPHLTFQEYFSALYVSTLSKEEQSEIIGDWKFYPHMQMFFTFLGGLIEDKEFLLEEIESDYRDLVGFYELLLLLDCISEISEKAVNAKRIKKIHSNILSWLKITTKLRNNYDTFDYNILLNKLDFIQHIIPLDDNEIINFKLRIIQEDVKEGYMFRGKKIMHPLTNNKILDLLISIVKDKVDTKNDDEESDYNSYIYKPIVEHLISSQLDNNKINNLLIELIFNSIVSKKIKDDIMDYFIFLNHKNLTFKIRKRLMDIFIDTASEATLKIDMAKYLISLEKTNNEILNFLKQEIENSSESSVRRSISTHLISLNNEKIMDILVEIINNQKINLNIKYDIIDSFISKQNIPDNIIDVSIEIFKSKESFSSDKIQIAKLLLSLNQKNEYIFEYFREELKNYNRNFYYINKIINFLILYKKDIDFNIIKNDSIELDEKLTIIELLIDSMKYNDEMLEILQDLIKGTDLSLHSRIKILQLLLSLGTDIEEFIQEIIDDIIEESNLFWQVSAIEFICSLDKLDNTLIDLLISICQNPKKRKDEAISLLIQVDKKNKKVRKCLSEILYFSKSNHSVKVMIIKSNFQNYLLNIKDFSSKDLELMDALMNYSSLENILNAYIEEKNISIESIVNQIIERKTPLYIKNNNKLYTIENGKEIHTQRALTAEEITTIQNKTKKETL